MDKKSKIIILRGNSGSGKTTVAKALQKKNWSRYIINLTRRGS